MVTSLILFDRFSTFRIWTRFCISNHPGYVIRLVPVLEIPFCRHFAVTGPVGDFATFEAESHSALASNVFNGQVSGFNAVSTARSGAPFDTFVVVSEGLTVEFKVGLLGFKSFKNLLPDRMRNFHGAFYLRTVRLETNVSHCESFVEIVSPAVDTKSMSACHS